MQIKPNYFLKPTDRTIKLWDRDIISVDGPNIVDRVSLKDIAIGYSDFYVSRQVLESNTIDVPLYFDGIEEELIFLLVRVRKDTEYNPNYVYDITKNINYYFSGDTDNVFPIGEFFIQTGSYQNKVKKLYFNNNNDFNVVLDIFGAILEKPTITIPTGTTTYQNLYLEDIITNTSDGEYVDDYVDDFFLYITGSTALRIISGDIIPYTEITNIVKSGSTKTIYITTDTHSYELIFLTDFDFNQAYSRIMFVMDLPIYRFLTEDYIFDNNSGRTGINNEVPIILYHDGTGVTYSIPSGATLRTTYTKNELLEYFISGVTDSFDGVLDITGATSKLNKKGGFVSLTGITDDNFIYELSFIYTNSANNSTGGTIGYIYVNLDPISNAGPDNSVCENSTFTTSGATTLNSSSILWSTSGDGVLSGETTLTPTYYPGTNDIINGSVELMLTSYPISPVTNISQDSMTLNIISKSIANAGSDDTTNIDEYQINGASAQNQISILWTTSGDGIFDDATLENPIYILGSGDTKDSNVILTMSTYSQTPCGVDQDSMILNIDLDPVSDAGIDTSICENYTSYTLSGASTKYSSAILWTTSGDGVLSGETTLTPTYYPDGDDVTNGLVEFTLTSYPIAPNSGISEDIVNLMIRLNSIANAGPNDTTNTIQYQLSGASAQNQISILWTTSGDGTFDNSGIENPTYNIGSNDINNGNVTLTMITSPYSPCNLDVDSMFLNIDIDP